MCSKCVGKSCSFRDQDYETIQIIKLGKVTVGLGINSAYLDEEARCVVVCVAVVGGVEQLDDRLDQPLLVQPVQ